MIGELISAGANLLGGWLGQKSQDENAANNIKYQKQFAKNSIQWRAADALKAGIHPIYALGASGSSFSPVSVGDSMGPAIAAAGNDIGRAVATGMSPEGQVSAKMTALALERGGLENELLRSQIRSINAPGSPPGISMPGSDPSDPMKIFGRTINAHPGFSDAQVIENRYGELGDWLYGLPVMSADAVHNLDVGSAERRKQQGRFDAIADAVYNRLFGGK